MTSNHRILGIAVSLVLASGLAHADYEDGVNAALAGDYDTALREFTAAAEQGLALAQYNLAILYFTGRGVDQDLAAAYRWTLAAAEQGHVNAQYNLASLLMDGAGVDMNVEQAITWFGQAGKAGHPDAAFVLANLYYEGERVAGDPVLAHAWASQAVYNEHDEAATLQDQIQQQMNAEQLGQARRLFARWQIQ